LLNSKMSIESIYIVNQGIINSIWDREVKVSKKESREYCTLKKRFLENIIHNRSFEREGDCRRADEYYGFHHPDFIMQSPVQNGKPYPYGFILDKKQDAAVLEYLQRKDVYHPS